MGMSEAQVKAESSLLEMSEELERKKRDNEAEMKSISEQVELLAQAHRVVMMEKDRRAQAHETFAEQLLQRMLEKKRENEELTNCQQRIAQAHQCVSSLPATLTTSGTTSVTSSQGTGALPEGHGRPDVDHSTLSRCAPPGLAGSLPEHGSWEGFGASVKTENVEHDEPYDMILPISVGNWPSGFYLKSEPVSFEEWRSFRHTGHSGSEGGKRRKSGTTSATMEPIVLSSDDSSDEDYPVSDAKPLSCHEPGFRTASDSAWKLKPETMVHLGECGAVEEADSSLTHALTPMASRTMTTGPDDSMSNTTAIPLEEGVSPVAVPITPESGEVRRRADGPSPYGVPAKDAGACTVTNSLPKVAANSPASVVNQTVATGVAASTPAPDPALPVKRGRGRPRKYPLKVDAAEAGCGAVSTTISPVPVPGAPQSVIPLPEKVSADMVQGKEATGNGSIQPAALPVKRGRGRPRKYPLLADASKASYDAAKASYEAAMKKQIQLVPGVSVDNVGQMEALRLTNYMRRKTMCLPALAAKVTKAVRERMKCIKLEVDAKGTPPILIQCTSPSDFNLSSWHDADSLETDGFQEIFTMYSSEFSKRLEQRVKVLLQHPSWQARFAKVANPDFTVETRSLLSAFAEEGFPAHQGQRTELKSSMENYIRAFKEALQACKVHVAKELVDGWELRYWRHQLPAEAYYKDVDTAAVLEGYTALMAAGLQSEAAAVKQLVDVVRGSAGAGSDRALKGTALVGKSIKFLLRDSMTWCGGDVIHYSHCDRHHVVLMSNDQLRSVCLTSTEVSVQ